MKIAFTYDRINKFGGAERVLLALHEIWPDAPIYTAVYNPATAQWANDIDIRPSWLQKIPYFRTRHELLPFLTPLAFEQFDFSDYDVVLSVTSAEAKHIITNTKTKHVCYCLTPTRYLWSHQEFYQQQGITGWVLKQFAQHLKRYDFIAAQRVDHFIAISKAVQSRISKYYQKESKVIYPPVEVAYVEQGQSEPPLSQPYYLVVSRLVPYKRIDIAIQACNQLNRHLLIVGQGSQLNDLKKIAGSTISFVKNLTDYQLSHYYKHCRGVLFPGEEDFGIVPVEAQAYGKPVIAYNKGGATETVLNGKTGLLFNKQTVKGLVQAIIDFEQTSFTQSDCQHQAEKFAKETFKIQIKTYIEELDSK